ncbi:MULTISPECIES: RNase adapter RapZ [unclassified Arthrobacter]|uniref:RNase adapter RapZ n=1 Tax=unclassified Arthrobacter TaxID=235627 RepID=UPI001F046992|nr:MULTISPECIES: RNase adapter RapZ [unclassified Arthrobacter]
MLIIMGLSGAGRSSAANALEDQGWYVLTNLPPLLLRSFTDLMAHPQAQWGRLAVVLDVRDRTALTDLQSHLRSLSASGIDYHLLFLEASSEELERRFVKEARPHPVLPEASLQKSIAADRQLLASVREASDLVIDTTSFNVHTLSTSVAELFSATGVIVVRINVVSFGFKYGLPVDADHVVDVRFLPNPHWVEALRPLDGRDEAVSDYVLAGDGAINFLDGYARSLEPVIQGYRQENKHYATIAVGCTGGKHRSVAMASALKRRLTLVPDVRISLQHRDLGRE